MTDQPPAPGLSLLVHRPGEPPAQHYTGTAHLETGTPIGPATTFNVGSVAKQFTAHLTVLADQDNRIGLARPAADMLPQLKIPDVTLADLITHHGGIRDAESLLPLAGFRDLDHYTAADLLTLAYRQDQRAVPAGRFLYSNTGYLMLTQILETVHGAELPTIAEAALFGPLAMTATVFKDDPQRVVCGAASSYRQTAGGGWEHAEQPVALAGPGSLWSTAADLDRWLGHLHAQWQASGTPLPGAYRVPYRPSDHSPDSYGPGLYSTHQGGHAAVFHFGHEQGFSAAVYLDRGGLRVIALSNNAHATADHAASQVVTALRRDPDADVGATLERQASANGRPAADAPTAPKPKTTGDQPHTMIGTFTCDQVPGSVRLSHSNGDLYLWRRGTHDRLNRVGPTSYTGPNYALTLADPDAPISTFVLDLDRAPGLHYQSQSR
ncbi:serine hydrolase domain-containing protein [Streptacidiphilus sp. MAP5-52]|uniref:serine hydrolase domain-containing protein n=1 Tax=Streptacidiphilus sp. MAP5-52 TaxID=3156267 RepID=UPI003512572F